jgi:putative endonuclease
MPPSEGGLLQFLPFVFEHPQRSLDADRPATCVRRGLVGPTKRFVYVLQSISNPSRHYTGLTSDVARRLASHNSGASVHTKADRPWEVNVVIEFRTEELALEFETYLKSGSGRAFARQHF